MVVFICRGNAQSTRRIERELPTLLVQSTNERLNNKNHKALELVALLFAAAARGA